MQDIQHVVSTFFIRNIFEKSGTIIYFFKVVNSYQVDKEIKRDPSSKEIQ